MSGKKKKRHPNPGALHMRPMPAAAGVESGASWLGRFTFSAGLAGILAQAAGVDPGPVVRSFLTRPAPPTDEPPRKSPPREWLDTIAARVTRITAAALDENEPRRLEKVQALAVELGAFVDACKTECTRAEASFAEVMKQARSGARMTPYAPPTGGWFRNESDPGEARPRAHLFASGLGSAAACGAVAFTDAWARVQPSGLNDMCHECVMEMP